MTESEALRKYSKQYVANHVLNNICLYNKTALLHCCYGNCMLKRDKATHDTRQQTNITKSTDGVQLQFRYSACTKYGGCGGMVPIFEVSPGSVRVGAHGVI